jgi:hypothetical protein
MRPSAGPSGNAGAVRIVAGLVRFAVVLVATLVRLVIESAGRPDPIDLQPRILQRSDDGGRRTDQ